MFVRLYSYQDKAGRGGNRCGHTRWQQPRSPGGWRAKPSPAVMPFYRQHNRNGRKGCPVHGEGIIRSNIFGCTPRVAVNGDNAPVILCLAPERPSLRHHRARIKVRRKRGWKVLAALVEITKPGRGAPTRQKAHLINFFPPGRTIHESFIAASGQWGAGFSMRWQVYI